MVLTAAGFSVYMADYKAEYKADQVAGQVSVSAVYGFGTCHLQRLFQKAGHVSVEISSCCDY